MNSNEKMEPAVVGTENNESIKRTQAGQRQKVIPMGQSKSIRDSWPGIQSAKAHELHGSICTRHIGMNN